MLIRQTSFQTVGLKGTVCVILSVPPCKDSICPIYNGTLELIKNVKPRKVLNSVNFSIDSNKQENVQFTLQRNHK